MAMRACGLLGLLLGAASASLGVASAATVRGTITLPQDTADPRETQWRVENGVLPVGPRQPDPHSEVIVMLVGGRVPTRKEEPQPAQVELHGLRLDPRVLPVLVGTTVEFKNNDRVPHSLYVDRATTVMAPQPTPAAQSRKQKFDVAGEYRIRDEDYPHIQGAVVAVSSPYFTRVDDKGAFRLEVPEGKYTLKVFYRTNWVVSQPLDVGPHAADVTVPIPASAGKR
jgi:plastocyanin